MPSSNPSDTPSSEESALAKMAPIISHEIRNPLAVIGNSVYFIKTKLAAADIDPKVQKHLGIIESEVRRANETLTEILAFARMREPALSPQRLNALVAAALGALAVPESVRLERDFSPQDPAVLGDAELLDQALRHVLRNGLESLCSNPLPKPCLQVRTWLSEGWAMAEVADNGPGLPPEILDKLFTPFTTAKPRGIGLGLSFTRKVLERHDGRVEAENLPSGGACMRIALKAVSP